MRLTIAKKIAIVFASLAIISLIMASGLLLTLRGFGQFKADFATVQEFQQKTESLEYLERELILRHQAPTDDRVQNAFLLVQGLADETNRLVQQHKIDSHVDVGGIMAQIEVYKQANLELFHLYREKSSFAERDRLLWDILLARIRILPERVRGRMSSFFTDIFLLQIHQLTQGYNDDNNAQAQRIAENVMEEIDEPHIQEGIKEIINNSQKNYQLHLAIEAKEELITKISANFERVIRLVVTSVSEEIIHQRSLMRNVLIFLSLLMVCIVLLAWRFTHKYCKEFLKLMQSSISAIRQEDFDYTLPAVNNDEFGDQLLFVKEMADSVKANMAKIAASEQRFRGMVENISDWIWLVDTQDICIYSSPHGAVMTGRQGAELIGGSVKDLMGGGDNFVADDPLAHELAGHRSFDALLHTIDNNQGGERDLETSGRPVFNEEGEYQGYRFISRDISDVKKAEKSLRENALSQKFNNAVLGLSLLDLDLDAILSQFLEVVLAPSWLGLEPAGVVFLTNETGQALEMWAQKGLNINIPITCGIVPFGVCLCGRAAQTGKVVFCNTIDERHEVTFEGMHLHGHYCVPIHSVAGKVIGVFTAYIKDGTPRNARVEAALNGAATILGGIIKRRVAEEKLHVLNVGLEEEVTKRTTQLTAANKELDIFAYSVSHDLRAPLRAIDGFSMALLEDYNERLDEEGREYIARLRKGCARMGHLIEDILQLSRLTRGTIDRQTVDISEMAAEVFQILAQGDSSRQVKWTVAPDLKCEGDPVMIRAVWDNLLGNAWKYSSTVDEANIEVSAEEMDGEMVYCVKDNGVGFDMAYKDKLFTAFQRLHSSEEFEGSGIGLATVQRIINRHGGKIWAEGEEGKGAKFYFSL